MKRIAWLFLLVLGSVSLMYAQSATTTMDMSGTICRSTCIVQVDNRNTCNTGCIDNESAAVLVDDQGNIHQIAAEDQPMCESHMNKHVKVKMQPVQSEDQRERQFRIIQWGANPAG